jgi:hypothetical protein
LTPVGCPQAYYEPRDGGSLLSVLTSRFSYDRNSTAWKGARATELTLVHHLLLLFLEPVYRKQLKNASYQAK